MWSLTRRPPANKLLVTMVLAFVLSLWISSFATGVTFARPRVALVLGGGSSRGLSHIGLLKALEEEGIPVDYIVGTSMGSVVAGLYAAGFSAENLQFMVRHMDLAELFILTIPPGGGFIDTQRFRTFLDVLTDNVDFSELPIPFYTVVINLVTGEEVTLHEGSLSRGIMASMSVPGVFPPVRIGDDYFVDGGLRNLAPVGVARAIGVDMVIAADVRRTLESIDHDALSSNLQLTLMMLLAQNTDAQLELADIVIAPDVDSGSYMDYERVDHFIAAGYKAAKAMAPEMKQALLALDPGITFERRQPGLPVAEFAGRMRIALNESDKQAGNESPAAKFALLYDSEGVSTDVGLVVPFGRLAATVPVFATYSVLTRAGRSAPTVGVGIGQCRRTCATTFIRRMGDLPDEESSEAPRWRMGFGMQGRMEHSLRYAAEWVPGQTDDGSLWQLRLTTPAVVHNNEGNEWNVTLQNDHVEIHEQAADTVQGNFILRRFIPWSSTDVWEAVRTSTAFYVGAGAQAMFKDTGPDWRPIGELGIAFEARLFGLYPLRSRIALTYRGGDAVPWSLGWTLGEP